MSRSARAAAEQELLALELNTALRTVRVGVSDKDPALWRFATQLQVVESEFNAAKRAYEQFFAAFKSVVTSKLHALATAHPDEFGRFQGDDTVTSTQAGSVANSTHFLHCDLDRILVLNSRHPVTYDSDADSLSWHDSTHTSGAVKRILTETVGAAVDECIRRQRKPASFTLDSFRIVGKSRFTFKSSGPIAAVGLEFDLLPALIDSAGSYFLIDIEGKHQLSDNELAVLRIEQLSKHFIGLREMIKSLKLASKAHALTHSRFHVTSCVYETATMIVAETRKEKWWRDATFTDIFRAALALIGNRLNAGTALPAPNDPSSNVLACVDGDEMRGFIEEWRSVEEAALLNHLETAYNAFSGHVAITLSRPIESSSATFPTTAAASSALSPPSSSTSDGTATPARPKALSAAGQAQPSPAEKPQLAVPVPAAAAAAAADAPATTTTTSTVAPSVIAAAAPQAEAKDAEKAEQQDAVDLQIVHRLLANGLLCRVYHEDKPRRARLFLLRGGQNSASSTTSSSSSSPVRPSDDWVVRWERLDRALFGKNEESYKLRQCGFFISSDEDAELITLTLCFHDLQLVLAFDDAKNRDECSLAIGARMNECWQSALRRSLRAAKRQPLTPFNWQLELTRCDFTVWTLWGNYHSLQGLAVSEGLVALLHDDELTMHDWTGQEFDAAHEAYVKAGLVRSSTIRTARKRARRPVHVLVPPNELLLVDQQHNCVLLFKYGDSGASLTRTIGRAGSGAGELAKPSSVAIHPVTGELYVADTDHHRIVVFSAATGDYIRHWGDQPNMETSIAYPRTLLVSADGESLFVTERSSRRILVFSPETGQLRFKWSTDRIRRGAKGDLQEPSAMCWSASTPQQLLVADRELRRVTVFSATDGAYVHAWDCVTTSGDWIVPTGISNPQPGLIFISDLEGCVAVMRAKPRTLAVEEADS